MQVRYCLLISQCQEVLQSLSTPFITSLIAEKLKETYLVSYSPLACLQRVVFQNTFQVTWTPDLDKDVPGLISLGIR